MCRHLAWLGGPRTLQALVVDRPHALYEQSWAPRRQQHGTVNVDGFGAGWYVDHPHPVRYRRAQPIWTDASFASLAPTIAASCVLAAVRSATPGTAADEGAAAPFTHDRWLFSHNGRLHDWATARKALGPQAADVPDTRVGVDSALLFGLALARWQAGASLPDGLAGAAPTGALQMVGDVWEWTSTEFTGYPGFRSFPYKEYSEVFFDDGYKVLRGGCWATDPLACRTTFRNWDHPIRRQIFSGFRTARDV